MGWFVISQNRYVCWDSFFFSKSHYTNQLIDISLLTCVSGTVCWGVVLLQIGWFHGWALNSYSQINTGTTTGMWNNKSKLHILYKNKQTLDIAIFFDSCILSQMIMFSKFVVISDTKPRYHITAWQHEAPSHHEPYTYSCNNSKCIPYGQQWETIFWWVEEIHILGWASAKIVRVHFLKPGVERKTTF